RAELDQQAETLKMTVREWQAWLDEVLRRTEKQLTVLQKDFAALDAAAREISSEIAARTRELAALRFSTEAALPSRQNTSGFPSQFQLEALERENQIGRLQSQFDALAAKANVISSQARGLLAERSAAARQFQQATGQLARQDATIQKWEKLLEKSAARNEPKDATRTNAYRALTTRLTLVATYFELDLEAERKRLLAELVAEPVSGQ
ncbi:MAG TPA: hypothetical protein VML55_24170, partial [Planctomycetaceae bacterium]|nr:hypothetical protein [Planctomycetaceae bacterium]